MSVRPCTCERYRPRRPYRPGRDCHVCWLYAHRASVRRAWGGDDRALPVDAPRPGCTAEELADFLTDFPTDLPEGWKLWPASRDAHLLLVERFLAEMPPYPDGRFAGRGAVVCGGGKYEASAYVCIRMLRHVGWTHPIQLWHRGPAEPVGRIVRDLPGVEVVDILPIARAAGRPVRGGWDAKTLAILASPFEEVLFLDADCYPVFNPDVCFEPANNPHGLVVWPDFPHSDAYIHWPTYGMTRNSPALNGGHYVIAKRPAWNVLQLAHHYDSHSDYYYSYSLAQGPVGALGDQEQMRVAIQKLNAAHTRYAQRPLSCDHGMLLQAGPGGRPLFVHRIAHKFAPNGEFPQPPRWCPGSFPMEATAWRYFLDWLARPHDTPEFPDQIPGWFTREECELWHRACRDRDVLELGRHHGRSTVTAAAAARFIVSLDETSADPADRWLERHGLRHRAWLRTGRFDELIPTCGGPFSACLIDGVHSAASVHADIECVRPHLAPGAFLGFHDYGSPLFPDVKPTVDAAALRYGWTMIGRAGLLAVYQT